jgi:hypothetical protein
LYEGRTYEGISSDPERKWEDLMIQQQIQQEASRIASEQKLGALQKEYHTQCRTGPLPATILQVLSLLFSCWLIFLYVSHFVPVLQAFSSFSASFTGLFFFLGPFFLIVSTILCCSYWGNYPFRHSREFLYENGFLLIACRNEHIIGSEAIRWSEVGAICYNFSHNSDADSTDESYTLQYSDGAPFGNHVCKQKGKQSQPHNGPYWVNNTSCEYRFPPELGRVIEPFVLRSPSHEL